MIRDAIAQLVDGKSLDRAQAAQVMEEIMTGEATPAQIGAFTVALRQKGETVDEITGFAGVMRDKSIKVSVDGPVLDTCGTGGDGAGTMNISTAAAFVAAGAGATVAKHGNRAMSSACGSADLLEALGVNINLGAAQVARCLTDTGIGFMFAQLFHPAMKYAAGPRREIGVRTVFNFLGPLTNPAGARHQLLGVPNEETAVKLANALNALGSEHALVVTSGDGWMNYLQLPNPSYMKFNMGPFEATSSVPGTWDSQLLTCRTSPGEMLKKMPQLFVLYSPARRDLGGTWSC